MDMKENRSRLLSILLIMAVLFTMLFVDVGVSSAATDRGKVKVIKYVYPASVAYEENTNGQWSLDKYGETYYRYSYYDATPTIFTAEYENGEEVTYSYAGGKGDSLWSLSVYQGSDGTRLRLYNPVRSNQEEKHFTVGGDNSCTFQLEGTSVKIPVMITASQKEKTVKSIEYEPVIKKIDYSQCQTVYNAEKDKEQLLFRGHANYNEGDKLTVKTKDGVSKTYTYEPGKTIAEADNEIWVDPKFVAEDNSVIWPDEVRVSDDQDLYEWGYDKDCYYLVEYGGAITKVSLTGTENDIDSISLYVREGSDGPPTLSCDEWEFDEGNGIIDGITVNKKEDLSEIIKYQSKWIDDGEGSGYFEEGFFDESGNRNEDLEIRHLNLKETGQWYVFYRGVSCPIETYHSPTWNVKEKPTCNKSGVFEGICSGCGELQGTKEIPAEPMAHKFSNYVYNNDARVGVDGTETATCDNGCGATNTRTKSGSALSSGGSSGGGLIPPITEQKPTIATDNYAETSLSADGTKLTIKVLEGYELEDVTLNGVSLGKVTVVSNLKAGDRVVITTKKGLTAEEEAELDKIERIEKGVQATTVKARLKAYKGKTKISWTKSKGYKVDGYNVYKSTKKNGTYKFMGKTKKQYMYHTKGLKKGTRYYYYVRGYRTVDGEKIYTKRSLKATMVAK